MLQVRYTITANALRDLYTDLEELYWYGSDKITDLIPKK